MFVTGSKECSHEMLLLMIVFVFDSAVQKNVRWFRKCV